jgi:signal transduction histidine kinase
MDEQRLVVSSLSPGAAQRRLAVAVVLSLLVALALSAGPLASIPPRRIDAFIPSYVTAMFITDSITAVLLFAQFSIVRSRALLVIASGYVFTALILIPFILTFPGALGPTALIGGLQSPPWLYAVWHGGFALFVVAYTLLKDLDPPRWSLRAPARTAIASSVGLTAGVVLAATWIITSNDARLPRLQLDAVRLTTLWPYTYAPVVASIVAALIVLWLRGRSVLDLWLAVVMCAYLMEICLNYYPAPIRYSVGWYAGRVCGILSASLILMVLLSEITVLYADLLRAVLARRREREARMMTGETVSAAIAHEVKQPLSAMVTSASAGLLWLDRSTPNLDEAKTAFKQVIAAGHRASAVIGSIRGLFKKQSVNVTSFDVNDLIHDALALVRGDLQAHRIAVQAEPDARAHVLGDRIQLQQVLVNLMTNAIDAMAVVAEPRVLSVRSRLGEDGVVVSVADTGGGVGVQDLERIFSPLFTTKPDGMGMGLSICRSIIEAHDGRLWAVPNSPKGAQFQFLLRGDPAAPVHHASTVAWVPGRDAPGVRS